MKITGGLFKCTLDLFYFIMMSLLKIEFYRNTSVLYTLAIGWTIITCFSPLAMNQTYIHPVLCSSEQILNMLDLQPEVITNNTYYIF